MKHPTPPALKHLDASLRDLEERGLLRMRRQPVPVPAESFCSNDYLGLTADRTPPAGAGASRLVVGERPEHLELEGALAAWLGCASALLFTSGYAANVGVVSSLVRPGDLVISDALNHASIIDGCRLSRARVEVVPHLDVVAVIDSLRRARTGRAWVVTESYFSMDADGPDLQALREACDRYDAALLLDEAHALGVFGPEGRGLAAEADVTPDVLIGTLGKSFGAGGAFAAGSEVLTAYLWNRARSFVFSTGLSPLVAKAALGALPMVSGGERRARLLLNARHMREGLQTLGLHPLGRGPIIPILIGDARRALRAASSLQDAGVYVQAIRPPTVPEGSARLRLTVTARHSPAQIETALGAFHRSIEWLLP